MGIEKKESNITSPKLNIDAAHCRLSGITEDFLDSKLEIGGFRSFKGDDKKLVKNRTVNSRD
jgi:hypothetical protein